MRICRGGSDARLPFQVTVLLASMGHTGYGSEYDHWKNDRSDTPMRERCRHRPGIDRQGLGEEQLGACQYAERRRADMGPEVCQHLGTGM